MSDFTPAVAIPTWEFIDDELTARGWTRLDLAERMGGEVEVNLCALDFLEALPWKVTLGEVADQLAVAFGTSAEVWTYTHESYRRAFAANPGGPAE